MKRQADAGAAADGAEPGAAGGAKRVRVPHARALGVGIAFRRIIRPLTDELRLGAAEGSLDDPEVIHRQRVAIRRLRSVLVLFAPCLEAEGAARFDARLRDLARIWGEARDWDMACLKSLPAAVAAAPGDEATAILDAAEAERETAHARLEASRADGRQTALAGELLAWASRGSCMRRGMAGTAVAEVAPDLLRRLEKRVRRRGRGIGGRSRRELHALRKALKRLNYGAEALGTLYPAEAMQGFHEACAGLLDRLGRINDAIMARELARRIEAGGVPAKRFVRPWAGPRWRKARRRLPPLWRAFRAAPRPWG